MSEPKNAFLFCQSELKRLDPVRHFANLTVEQDKREDIAAFHCFLAEIASIPKRVTEPAMGEIRLQWWQDVIEQSASAGSKQDTLGQNAGPVAAALKTLQQRCDLSPDILLQIIEARRFDLYNDPMPDMAAFETYAGETEALPLMLSAQILGLGGINLSYLCGHAAMAITLAQHLFEWPNAASQQKLFLPADRFSNHCVSTKGLISDPCCLAVGPAITALCDLAEDHHSKALAALKQLPKDKSGALTPLFLRLAPAQLMIKNRKKRPLDLLHLSNWRAYWRIWRMAALY